MHVRICTHAHTHTHTHTHPAQTSHNVQTPNTANITERPRNWLYTHHWLPTQSTYTVAREGCHHTHTQTCCFSQYGQQGEIDLDLGVGPGFNYWLFIDCFYTWSCSRLVECEWHCSTCGNVHDCTAALSQHITVLDLYFRLVLDLLDL